MRIIIDILHPGHVHFYKNFIKEMKKKGHNILITAREKDVSLNLLKAYGFEYTKISKAKKGLFGLLIELINRDYKFYKIAKRFKPDILMGNVGPTISIIGKLTKIPTLVFQNNEAAKLTNIFAYPLASAVITPQSYEGEVRGNHIIYPGNHELAYLHPNYFKPNKNIFKKIGLRNNEKFIIIRFVALQAAHDINVKGISNKIKIINELEKYGRVMVSSEKELPKELKKYKTQIPPEKLHDLLAFATLYIGESATFASEAACLGVPSIYVCTSERGYTKEQEKRFGLVYNFHDEDFALKKAIVLLKRKNLKKEWKKKHSLMLKKQIDVTKWMVNFVENFYKNLKK